MAHNETVIDADPDEVWAVLDDPTAYAHFVVGTREIREFDAGWPRPGTSIHHTVGIGPFVIRDSTTVVDAEDERELRMHASLGPTGTGEIVFTVERAGPGSTRLSIDEYPIDGPVALLWNPVFDLLMWLRNHEVLRRVGAIATAQAVAVVTA